MRDITPIGITNWRNQQQPFGIKDQDRFGHIYVIGKTGVGKSTLLLNMAISDIQRGNGLCIIDPHGDLVEKVLDYIPQSREDDIIYFNPADIDFPISFNPLKAIHPNHHTLTASGLISTFKKIWSDSWGPRLEHILRLCIITLLEYPHATLLDIQPLLTNPVFRSKVLSFCTNTHTFSFWTNEYNTYTPAFRSEVISPILNKVGLFTTNDILRNIVGQRINGINIQSIMDNGKILLCNLSKGLLGEDVSTILGSVIVTSIQLATLFRARIPEHTRIPFFLYVDEMHSFVSLSFADMLAEARKYKLGLFLTHQYLDQLHESIRNAVIGNIGTLIAFRVGTTDAEILAKEFYPVFSASDLLGLPRYSMYIKLMIDGATSLPFSAQTVEVVQKIQSMKEMIITDSRNKWSRPRVIVEREIAAGQYNKTGHSTLTLF